MHHVGENIAWILPPRTGTRYTITLINQQSYFGPEKCLQHEVILDRLGDRLLYMNVRNPYTRLASYWRLLLRNKRQVRSARTYMAEGSFYDEPFEKYVERLARLDNFDDCQRYRLQFMIGGIRYPFGLAEYLKDTKGAPGEIPPERIDKLIRMESFYQDLRDVGFDPNIPKVHGWGHASIQLDWFEKNPEYAKIVSRLYAKDFEFFGYDTLG